MIIEEIHQCFVFSTTEKLRTSQFPNFRRPAEKRHFQVFNPNDWSLIGCVWHQKAVMDRILFERSLWFCEVCDFWIRSCTLKTVEAHLSQAFCSFWFLRLPLPISDYLGHTNCCTRNTHKFLLLLDQAVTETLSLPERCLGLFPIIILLRSPYIG